MINQSPTPTTKEVHLGTNESQPVEVEISPTGIALIDHRFFITDTTFDQFQHSQELTKQPTPPYLLRTPKYQHLDENHIQVNHRWNQHSSFILNYDQPYRECPLHLVEARSQIIQANSIAMLDHIYNSLNTQDQIDLIKSHQNEPFFIPTCSSLLLNFYGFATSNYRKLDSLTQDFDREALDWFLARGASLNDVTTYGHSFFTGRLLRGTSDFCSGAYSTQDQIQQLIQHPQFNPYIGLKQLQYIQYRFPRHQRAELALIEHITAQLESKILSLGLDTSPLKPSSTKTRL